MNITNKHKLYLNVILLFIVAYMLTSLIIGGLKTQNFNYLRIAILVFLSISTILRIIKYNKDDENQQE
jgi:phosphoglycerol transferase MdoB-like AlkP superfamily enzyme